MADRMDPEIVDDAPLTASKRMGAAVDAATDALVDAPPEGHADTIIGRSVTINRPRDKLYAFWRDFSNLPAFMDNVVQVELLDDAARLGGLGDLDVGRELGRHVRAPVRVRGREQGER